MLQTASAVTEKAKKILHRRGITFSIPPPAVLEQVDSYKMLEALNDSVQEKLDHLTKYAVCFSISSVILHSLHPVSIFHFTLHIKYGLK